MNKRNKRSDAGKPRGSYNKSRRRTERIAAGKGDKQFVVWARFATQKDLEFIDEARKAIGACLGREVSRAEFGAEAILVKAERIMGVCRPVADPKTMYQVTTVLDQNAS
jgi:hypothetical protein